MIQREENETKTRIQKIIEPMKLNESMLPISITQFFFFFLSLTTFTLEFNLRLCVEIFFFPFVSSQLHSLSNLWIGFLSVEKRLMA